MWWCILIIIKMNNKYSFMATQLLCIIHLQFHMQNHLLKKLLFLILFVILFDSVIVSRSVCVSMSFSFTYNHRTIELKEIHSTLTAFCDFNFALKCNELNERTNNRAGWAARIRQTNKETKNGMELIWIQYRCMPKKHDKITIEASSMQQ